MRRRRIRIAVVVASLATVASLRVDAGVGIERYESARPADAGPVMRKFERFTMKHGTAITGERVSTSIARSSGVKDKNVTPRMITDKLDEAHRKWRRTDNAGAKLDVEQALAWTRDNSATAIQIASLPELLTRAYVTLAMIAVDANDKKTARSWMTRLKAEIPDHPAIRAKFGPDAEKLYNEALKAASTIAHGKLVVRASNRRARIFINEVERGSEGVFEGELPVGEYRIFVTADSIGHRFDREVSAAAPTELKLDWDFQRSFVATPEWVGLIVPPTLKAKETDYLKQASQWIQSTSFYILSLRVEGAHRYLTGAVFTNPIGVERAGEILLDDSQEDARMEAFAAFLEKSTPSPFIVVERGAIKETPEPLPAPVAEAPFVPSDGVPIYSIGAWIVGGGAIVIGATSFFDAKAGSTDCTFVQCKYGLPVGAVGLGVFLSGMAWWNYRDYRDRKRTARGGTAFIAPSAHGALVGYAGSF